MSNITSNNYLDNIVELIRTIDTTELTDSVDQNVVSKVTEEQKVYFWIRLYLKDENINAEIGDDISINWKLSGEKLITKFICYGKTGLSKDHQDEMTNYNPEDDKKCLCLMIDSKMVNFNNDIPFIRTLFKTGYHYEYQLVKREDLQFIIDKNGMILDYFECDF
jgi:hypothetical protein